VINNEFETNFTETKVYNNAGNNAKDKISVILFNLWGVKRRRYA
jgi:hypothetical protein